MAMKKGMRKYTASIIMSLVGLLWLLTLWMPPQLQRIAINANINATFLTSISLFTLWVFDKKLEKMGRDTGE